MKKIFSSKYPYLILAIICAVQIVIFQYGVISYAFMLMTTESTIEVSARDDIAFTVHYLDNDFFGPGPVDHDLHYMMSFTDFIAVENSFAVELSAPARVQYAYTANETLIIRHSANGDRTTDPIVYHEATVIDQKSGELNWETGAFGQGPEEVPGGAYRVDPKRHILTYRDFQSAEAAQMIHEDVRSERSITFTAELAVDFTYVLTFPDQNRQEEMKASLVIPLTDEVYSPLLEGELLKEMSIVRYTVNRPGTPAIIITIIASVGLIFGVCFGIHRFRQEKCEKRREFASIMRKYSDEIVFADAATDISGYGHIPVGGFHDLLKLAINSGKHILCHHDDAGARFIVMADGNAYTYGLEYSS